ncbi:MAG: [LysW]-lysine hydrolase [Anaerolineae bacterium]|nr:[LysW]-lysine hydrolase [Anaerolineae bacterium]
MKQETASRFFGISPSAGEGIEPARDRRLLWDVPDRRLDETSAAAVDGLDLLRSLLEIPSLSGQEAAAAAFLADWMGRHGLRAFVDAVGNAVGIVDGGPAADGSPPQDVVLLGHIDTVGGHVPVRVEEGKLYGRGAVDAKGPLAAFAVAAAMVGPRPGWRIVVIAAVEEEAATSRGARHAAAQYRPAYCVIGEPSGWSRVTLGYKGRLLAHVAVRQPMSHTAGPAPSACELAVDLWNRVRSRVAELNAGRDKPWDQVLASLRSFSSDSDGLTETAQMMLGFRLPPDIGPEALQAELQALAGPAELAFEGAEVAYRADKNNALVRAFLAAIRAQGGQPGFVLKTGTSDMNVVGPIWRCPIVAYGPGDSSLDHTPHEHVAIEEWQRGVAVLVDMLQRVTAGQAAADEAVVGQAAAE